MTNQKWMDIPSKKRHFILGSFVDGMIYDPQCVDDALNLGFPWMMWIPPMAANGEIPISAPAQILTAACCMLLMSANIPDL